MLYITALRTKLNQHFETQQLLCVTQLQSYLNDAHLIPSVILRGNELLKKVPMDIDSKKKTF